MENILIWLLIFAGAAIALLGLLLIASERELKSKRKEIERLSTNVDAGELADAAQRNRDSQAELQQVSKANEALASEVVDLKARLETSDGRLREALTQQASAAKRERELDSEIVELQSQLEENQQNFHTLENSQQSLPNKESLAAIHADEQRQLQAKIADLEQEVENARQRAGGANELRARLAVAERQRDAAREETNKYEQEIRRWQERSAEGDENRHRLSALRAPFDALLAKHAELAAHHNEFEEDLAMFGGLMAMRASPPIENNTLYSGANVATAIPPGHAATNARATTNATVNRGETGEEEALTAPAAMPAEPLAGTDEPATKKKSRMGIFRRS